jgi:type VI secretion system secreted protein Hcp
MAVVDFFLKIDGIEGEAPDSKHKNEIQIDSWSWGASQGGSAARDGGLGAGKVQMQDFHFVTKVNKASPKLMLACATGDHIKKAVLVCRKAGGTQQEYLTITFSDLMIASYQTSGSGSSEVLPLDQIALNFTKIEMEYKAQDAKGGLGGGIKTGYDIKAQQNV